MKTLQVSDDMIMTVWEWCSEAYLQLGHRLAFPANTDRTKTYQWRYLRSIATKFVEWEFDDQTSKQFIETAARYCKNAGLLCKGLAALHQSNLLQVCYDEMQKKIDSSRSHADSIRATNIWLSERSSGDLVKTLLRRRDPDEFCNITKWFQSSRLPKLYLALSKSCSIALARLSKTHPEEREALPRTTTLYMLRSEFLKDPSNVSEVKSILGQDWREVCL